MTALLIEYLLLPKAAEPEPKKALKQAKPSNLVGAGARANFQSVEPESFFGSEQWLWGAGAVPEPESWSHDSELFPTFFTAKIGAGAFSELRSSGAFVHANVITK